jgi:hypothetical protein
MIDAEWMVAWFDRRNFEVDTGWFAEAVDK